ncbi:dihydroxyacetone kinase subunit DhaK [Paenibacillus monticola]|uniref:phosphoenolpyruvate--glycerone phosphotransferase n=1 Tax=Paenibacillus monticola TaxID=2666075 RepID=A0A7X2L2Y7_9BACL|nr:dihydroxyacetone kinase subunit DhaK [Paenibacillus monticola]MRN54683.1 dihydroxyacetone kinase subunit DhaK [Paenibacillus monticola]
MKKIINKTEDIVIEMCNGMVMAHPELEFVKKYKIIKKKEINQNKVSLISGGGSGHEPAHAGYVGKGMLDAAVCGDIFASPSQIQVYQALKATAGNKGALMIIKNYTGDMMNFRNAAFMAEEDGLQVDYVVVNDDISVQDSLYTVGRRGVAGTVLVHKIAGAAAEEGQSLQQVKAAAEKAAANVRSIGFALTSSTVPAKGTPTFELAEDEIEYGVGIHGEPGIRREKMATANVLAKRMLEALLADLKIDSSKSAEIALLINGFGGTPLQELYLLNNAVARELAQHKSIKVCVTFVGNYMTSIDMAGASVTLMKLDEELKALLFKESDTPAFKVSGPTDSVQYVGITDAGTEETSISYETETPAEYSEMKGNTITLDNMVYLVDKMSEIIIKNEVPFCELDSQAGDGDFGMSIAKGFRQLKREWKQILTDGQMDIGSFLNACSLVIMEYCGGASGPIWGSAFRSASKAVAGKKELTIAEFADMMQASVQGIQSTGERSFGRGAVVGDKTLIDALVPCADSWSKSSQTGDDFKSAFAKGADAAIEGAKKTEDFAARMGRAGTVGDRSLGYPDAGAYALGVIFKELSEQMK